MKQLQKAPTRKKFLLWGAALISSVAFFKFFSGTRKSSLTNGHDTKTVKMLTQDGRLVEVDKNLLASSGKKITNEELQQWINK
jgi:hypothetical protein